MFKFPVQQLGYIIQIQNEALWEKWVKNFEKKKNLISKLLHLTMGHLYKYGEGYGLLYKMDYKGN